MAKLIGPDLVALQVSDPERSAAFYAEVCGLERIEPGPPGAVVFRTQPVSFALRPPLGSLPEAKEWARGVALWMACDDQDALHARLVEKGVTIVRPPAEAPFGHLFAFRDPDGDTLTAHSAPGARS